MTWAQKRRLMYIGGLLAVFLLITIPLGIRFFYEKPDCTDGKQNQDEQGIDCGGSCSLLCRDQYAPLIIKWQRFSRVSDGVYNVLAYIENPNISARADNVNYVFRLYDQKGLTLVERSGKTFAPPNKVLAIFEGGLYTGNQIPVRAEFSFSSQAIWSKQESAETGLSVIRPEITKADTAPRLSFTLSNITTAEIKKIEAIGIVYDQEDNTTAFSRTIIDSISPREAQIVNFNWPKPFAMPGVRSEIVLRILK